MSVTLNVSRWSALGAGIIYGAYHRYSLELLSKKEQATAAYKKEERLIREAKAEYAKLNAPKQEKSASFNLEDPNLDFGKVLESFVQKLDQ